MRRANRSSCVTGKYFWYRFFPAAVHTTSSTECIRIFWRRSIKLRKDFDSYSTNHSLESFGLFISFLLIFALSIFFTIFLSSVLVFSPFFWFFSFPPLWFFSSSDCYCSSLLTIAVVILFRLCHFYLSSKGSLKHISWTLVRGDAARSFWDALWTAEYLWSIIIQWASERGYVLFSFCVIQFFKKYDDLSWNLFVLPYIIFESNKPLCLLLEGLASLSIATCPFYITNSMTILGGHDSFSSLHVICPSEFTILGLFSVR